MLNLFQHPIITMSYETLNQVQGDKKAIATQSLWKREVGRDFTRRFQTTKLIQKVVFSGMTLKTRLTGSARRYEELIFRSLSLFQKWTIGPGFTPLESPVACPAPARYRACSGDENIAFLLERIRSLKPRCLPSRRKVEELLTG